MPSILSTGHAKRCSQLTEALRLHGLSASTLPMQALGALAPASLDVYVQLPVSDPADAPGADPGGLEDATRFLRYGLLARFEAALLVCAALAPNALVVLVPGNTLPGGTPDRGGARGQLLLALAESIRAETVDRQVNVVVTPWGLSAEQIAAIVGSPPASSH